MSNQIVGELTNEIADKIIIENPPYLAGGTAQVPVKETVYRMSREIVHQAHDDFQNVIYGQYTKVGDKFYHYNGMLYYNEICISNYYIKIKKVQLVLDDEGNPGNQLYDIQVSVNHNGKNDCYEVNGISQDDLLSVQFAKKIPFALPQDVTRMEFKKYFEKYIYECIKQYKGPILKVYQYPGWKRIGGSWYYVDGYKAIGASGLHVRAESKLNIVKTAGLDLWKEFNKIAETIVDREKMYAVFLFSMISFLYRVYMEAGYPLKHLMFLVGERASRKTSLALCFTQLINKLTPDFNFRGTSAGIQSHFCEFADSVLLLDDLAPATTTQERNAAERKLEEIVRIAGDAGAVRTKELEGRNGTGTATGCTGFEKKRAGQYKRRNRRG